MGRKGRRGRVREGKRRNERHGNVGRKGKRGRWREGRGEIET